MSIYDSSGVNKQENQEPYNIKTVYKEILTTLDHENLLSNLIDSELEIQDFLESDSILVDKWLMELGFKKIGDRRKFLKLLKENYDLWIKKRNEGLPKNKIYIPDIDQVVEYNGTFLWPHSDAYRQIIMNSDPEEAIGDIKDTNGNIGVVVSLLLTMVFLQNGRDVTVSPNSMWESSAGLGQDILTMLLVINATICVCVILFTTRIYFATSMLPNSSGRLAMAVIGGDFSLNYALISFFVFAIGFASTILLWISLVFDKTTAIVMIVVVTAMVVLQLLMCGFNTLWPGGTVDMRFERAMRILFPNTKV